MADPLRRAEVAAQIQQERERPAISGLEGRTGITDLGRFLESAGVGMGELFGLEPSMELELWRARHPELAIASQAVGVLIPYGGWLKASTKIPQMAKALRAIEESELAVKAPLLGGAAKGMAQLAPFEAARIISTTALGGNVGEVSVEAAANLGIGGALGGIGALWRAARPALGEEGTLAAQIQKVLPEFNPSAPRQEQFRALLEEQGRRMATPGAATDPVLAQVNSWLNQRSLQIRTELPPEGRALLGLEGATPEQVAKVNRLFRAAPGAGPSPTSTLKRSFLTYTPSIGVANQQEYRFLLERFGLPQGFEANVQFPRYLVAQTKGKAAGVRKDLAAALRPVGEGLWLGREPDGLFVMAREIKPKPGVAGEFMIFKTDAPKRFAPGIGTLADLTASRAAFVVGQDAKKVAQLEAGVTAFDQLNKLQEALPFRGVGAAPVGKPAQMAKRIFEKLGVDTKLAGAEVKRVNDFLKEYVAPGLTQFSKSPLARHIYGLAKYAFDGASAKAEAIMYGAQQISESATPLKMIVQKRSLGGGIWGQIEGLGKKDFSDLVGNMLLGRTPVEAQAAGASESVVRALQYLDKVDSARVDEIARTLEIIGDPTAFKALKAHYGLTRTWKGDFRLRLYDQNGRFVYMASGHTAAEAEKVAKAVERETAALGAPIARRPGEGQVKVASFVDDLAEARRMDFSSPGFKLAKEAELKYALPVPKDPKFFKERMGLEGFQTRFTKDELRQALERHVYQAEAWMAEQAVREKLTPMLLRLHQEQPALFQQLLQRINDLSGKPTVFAQAQNRIADKLLSPFLGVNSATKIVSSLNTLAFNLQLGMLNIGFPIQNALTFLQTVQPHMAFVMSAAPETMAKYYTWAPIMAGGVAKGTLGTPSKYKIMFESFRQLARPTPQFQAFARRAMQEGLVDPRFVESYVGQKSDFASSIRAALTEGKWLTLMKQVSEFLPGLSEKFSRMHALSVGHLVGRDFMRLEGERLYSFMRDFVYNTMYGYSTAERARVITGPLGSFLGLFKNWQMHYTAQFLLYADEALMKGNFAPLLWQGAGTFALAGMGGMPLYQVADYMSRQFSDKSLMENVYEGLGYQKGDLATDALFFGIPAFLGVSMQGSFEAPFSDMARDASMLTSFAHIERAKAIGKALGSAFESYAATGEHPVDSASTRDLFMRALAPKTLYRAAQVVGDEAIRALGTGYPIKAKATPYERWLFAFGINPLSVDKAFQASDILWKRKTEMEGAVRAFGRAYAEALDAKDYREATLTLYRVAAAGVPMDRVMQSAAARRTKQTQDVVERGKAKIDAWMVERALGLQ